jgi:hypothetical protein
MYDDYPGQYYLGSISTLNFAVCQRDFKKNVFLIIRLPLQVLPEKIS